MTEQRTDERVLGLIWSRLDPDFGIVDRAGSELREIGADALCGLIRVLRGHAWKRGFAPNWEAVNWLATIGAEAVPEVLHALMESHDSGTRWAAGEALGYIAQPAVPALLQALTHPDPEIRLIATYALTACRDMRALPALLDALVDLNPHVALMAAKAISHIGDPRAVPDLQAILASGQCPCPNAVRWAINQLEAG